MDLLAGYGEDVGDDSATNSPKDFKVKSGHTGGAVLENEWLSFEKMIAPGGIQGEPSVDKSTYLVDGFVAYPGMNMRKPSTSEVVPEVQSSESDSDDEKETKDSNNTEKNGKDVEDDDAFFKLRKQVKARERSSSSEGTSDSNSESSRSPSPKPGSLSPPHLSPVDSVKSHGSDPPELEQSNSPLKTEQQVEEPVVETKVTEEKEVKQKSAEKERKRSHRDRSRSRSKKHRSRSRSRDKKRRHSSRERRRHKHDKDKKSHHKSRDGKHSRDRKRSRSKDRKRSKSRERKRSRSKDKQHDSKSSKSRSERRDSSKDRKKDKRPSKSRSHSKERKRSKSKDRKERRDRSRDRKKRHGGRKDGKHRSRSRDRSWERLRSRSPVMGKKMTFKEQMRQNILTASKQMSQDKEPEMPVKRSGEPLKPSDLLKGIRIAPGESVTPQQALMQTMAAMHQKAQEITGVEVPKYYNPAAVNPLKYAEQVQKRKLLWSKKGDDKQKEKEEQIETQWKSAFIADDNATTSKFRKLMGMKHGDVSEDSADHTSDEQRKKQQELMQRLDQEYQFARMTTHTQRGVGLGFSSTIYDPNHPPTNPP